jgi:hypothetical protein
MGAAMIFFLTGASGSGKSASLPGLRAALPSIDWRDFDEFGVPSPCPREWRPQTTERWVKVALENQRLGKNTGIAGGAIMGEVLACPSARRWFVPAPNDRSMVRSEHNGRRDR